MTPPFLGYLTDRRLALYDTGRTGWKLIREFDEGEAPELAGYLSRNRPLHLLADVVEMEFRFEKATFLRGGDRRALHDRKLQQTFRSSPFRHAFSLGRVSGRQGEEKLLLSAITNPELVSPWTTPLRQQHLPLSGIAGVPLLQKQLIAALGTGHPHVLLLTVQKHGRIRITHFFEKEMHFSRLAVHPQETATLGNIAFEEAVRTHQYLLSLRLVERSSHVDVVCLLPEEVIPTWHATQPSTGSLKFSYLSLAEAARLAGIKGNQAGESADDLFIGLLAKAGFPNHFAPSQERHGFHLYGLRRALMAGSSVVALGTVAGAGALIHSAWDLSQRTQQAETSAIALNANIQQVRDSFPRTSVPVEEIREALSLAQNLQKESAPVRPMLADLSRGFDAVPLAELHTLAWISSEHPENFSGEESSGGATDSSPPVGEASQAVGSRRWVAVLSGEIVGAGSYRQANSAVEKVAAAIRRDKVVVEILQYPLNVRSDAELKESSDQDMAERLPFKLRVIWNQ